MSSPVSGCNVVPFRRPEGINGWDNADLSLYECDISKFNLTPEQREEFLRALWLLMSGFIDFGFGIHPIQHPDIVGDLNTDIIQAIDMYSKKAA